MNDNGIIPWQSLAKWSPRAFMAGGAGLLTAFTLMGLEMTASLTIPESVVALLSLPSMVIIFLVALLGFYPYVSDASPRLALGGVGAAGFGGATLLVTTVGAAVLELTTETGFLQAEDNPILLALFFLVLISLLASFLLYGLASFWKREPSRLVGALFLLIIVEPGSALLFDLVGVNAGEWGPVATLGIAAMAMIAAGYFLSGEPESSGQAVGQPEPHTT